MSKTDSTPDSATIKVIKSNRETLTRLPDHAPFLSREVGHDKNILEKWQQRGIIKRWGEAVHRWETEQRDRDLWCLTEKCKEILDHLAPPPATTPCCTSGWVNLEDSDYYQCKTCNGRFTKEEILDG